MLRGKVTVGQRLFYTVFHLLSGLLELHGLQFFCNGFCLFSGRLFAFLGVDRLEHLSDLLYLGLVSTTDALGNTTAFAYDGADNLTSVTFADGTSFAYEYDRVGNLISQTDALGNVTAFEYDALRQLVKTTYPDGSEATGSYDASGNLISTTDADGNTATAAYDAVGNLVAVTDALGNTTAYEYDKTGQLTAETLANGGKTHYNYDNMGRVTSIVTATGEPTSYTYDAADNILTVTAPDGGVTAYTYDSMGRLLTETAPDGAVTRYTYDLAGNVSTVTDALGNTTSYAFDANGNLTEKQTARGTIHYAYDALNQIIAITDADGTVTNYEYDAVGNLVFREDEPEDETDVLSEPSEQGPEFYPELEANRFGQKGAVANGTVSPVFLRRSVSAGNAISIAAKSVEKSKGTLLKKKKAAPAIVTRDTAGKITKKTDTGASGTAITGKSKTVNILNRSIAAARIATAKKQTAAPQKPSASSVPLSTSRSLTASSPSVKAVTGTPVSCSAQVAVSSAEMGLGAWTTTMWWLTLADGPLPIGDAIYLGGAAVLVVVSGVVVVIDLIQTSNSVTLEPQGPTIILDPVPDITQPQIEGIPALEPDVGGNIPPFPSSTEEDDSNITSIPLPEEDGVQIITSDGETGINVDGGKISLSDLPENVQESFNKYDKAGWQGNVSGQTPGTNAGRKWGNRDSQLPTVDVNGNPITYREFDVNNYNGIRRDGERFVVGSDGSVWYTDSHYGQAPSLNGIPDFVRIK